MAKNLCLLGVLLTQADTTTSAAAQTALDTMSGKAATHALNLLGLGISRFTVAAHNSKTCLCHRPASTVTVPAPADHPTKTGAGASNSKDQVAHDATVTVTNEHADVNTGALEQRITLAADWDPVLRHFGLDPATFEIVDDTVRMSSWQSSKRTENGDRDLITLYAYRARFRRIRDRLPQEDVDKFTQAVHKWKPATRRAPGSGLGAPSTFYVGWADWQLDKNEGAGVAGTEQRVLDSIEQAVKRVKDLRRIGRNVTSCQVWSMGDPTENPSGQNYSSQTFQSTLTQREQLNLALNLSSVGIRELAPLFDDFTYGCVLCNHGEWTRQNGKAVTGDSDNSSGFIGDTLQRTLEGRPGFDHVKFAVPDDEMTMMSVMSGVPVGLNHGHKIGGAAEEKWLQAQSIRLLREHGREPRLWMTAHRHHYSILDYGPYTRIQHPSLDYGSKWFADTSGKWSTAGTFTCLVGEHEQAGGLLSSSVATGFSDEMVLRPSASVMQARRPIGARWDGAA